MKNKNQTGIFTALLAVLSIQDVGFKKKIGFITALAVLVSMTGIAAANPFNIEIIQPGGNPTTFTEGQTNTFGLNMSNFLASTGPATNRQIEVKFSNVACNAANTPPFNTNCDFGKFQLVRGLGLGTTAGVIITIPINQQVARYEPSSKDPLGTFDIKLNGPLTDPPGTRYSMSILAEDLTTAEPLQSATITVQYILPPKCGDLGQPPCPSGDEYWNVEWFNTMPWQFTEFVLPRGQDYLVTSAFFAPEAVTHIWDGIPTPLAVNHGDRLKFWHNAGISEDLYVNERTIGNQAVESSIKLYGYFNKGAGNLSVIDPVTSKKPEQAPYTDPVSPFYPQSRDSPRRDFATFNPAIMDHNEGYEQLIYIDPSNSNNIQRPVEKVFKRMWYEKAWFKDDYKAQANGRWDVVIDSCDPLSEAKECTYIATVPLDDEKTIHDHLAMGHRVREQNNDPNLGDTYAPAIEQEFAYMTLNDIRMPIMVRNGSHILVPMAHYDGTPYSGINSFGAVNREGMDALKVESEKTLGMDIDDDGKMTSIDTDGKDVSGDESIVLVLDNKFLSEDENLQFFDNVVQLKDVFTNPASIIFNVCDNEAGGSQNCANNQVLGVGQVAKFQRGMIDSRGPFYVKLIGVDTIGNKAIVEVGRLFGQTPANIGANARWNQKAFIVDGVFYNVVGIKGKVVNGVEQFKYIVIRQKLPKDDIKLYGKHLRVWPINTILPELPPFNMVHNIIVDVLETQDKAKIGAESFGVDPLEITYVKEAKERRFVGELKEIYNQSGNKEAWVVEWFNTMPFQYTEFVLPFGQKYLITTGFWAPEAVTHLWDGNATGEEVPGINHGDRLKFWHDASIGAGIYINGYTSFSESTLRLHGYFDEGPGDLNIKDPVTSKKPEQAPYTDPEAPFYPQSKQSPRKDFVTFNPAIMDHNSMLNQELPPVFSARQTVSVQGYPELIFLDPSNGNTIQRPQEKTFKRMWYEKAWFKDDYLAVANGRWDVVIEGCKPLDPAYECRYVTTLPIDDEQAIHEHLAMNHRIREHNNDPAIGDTYAPAIMQEFAYMTLNDIRMPIMVQSGSHILIPMAHFDDTYRGINSFDAADKGVRDAVKVESEKTLGMDIDNDGVQTSLDTDGKDVSGDESIVFVLDNKNLGTNDKLQFFDNVVTLNNVFTNPASIVYQVCDNEGGGSTNCANDQVLNVGQVAKYQRGMVNNKGPFYIKLIAVDTNSNEAVIEVGRLFGKTRANIGANANWNQKAFIVDEVFYNVVAIKTKVVNGIEQFKYIVIRQMLPKDNIKLYGKHLQVWNTGQILPELPPFNTRHEIIVDVLRTPVKPANMQDKIGEKVTVDRLEITYVLEDKERRFQGQLKEIYNQTGVTIPVPPVTTVTCAGDLTGTTGTPDGVVDFKDFTAFGAAYGTSTGNAGFNAKADITGSTGTPDGVVDFKDFTAFGARYGTSCSAQ